MASSDIRDDAYAGTNVQFSPSGSEQLREPIIISQHPSKEFADHGDSRQDNSDECELAKPTLTPTAASEQPSQSDDTTRLLDRSRSSTDGGCTCTAEGSDDPTRTARRRPHKNWFTTPIWLDPTFDTLAFLLLGLLTCLAHHLFNRSLHGKAVDNSTWISKDHLRNQEVISFFGTAFAFLVKAFYCAALSIAYEQVVWRSLAKSKSGAGGRERAFTLKGIDAAVSLPIGVVGWFERDVWRGTSTRLMLIAALIWMAFLGTVFTPGTISVITSEIVKFHDQYVPILDFQAVTNKRTYGSINLVVRGSPGSTSGNYTSPSTELLKLVRQTAESGSVVQGEPSPCGGNCSYTISFYGPAQKCEDIPDYAVEPNSPWSKPGTNDTFGRPANRVFHQWGLYYLAAQPDPVKRQDLLYTTGRELWVSYAFLPKEFWQSYSYERYPEGLPRDNGTMSRPVLEALEDPFLSERWQKRTFRCFDYNASYTITMDYINGVQNVGYRTITYANRPYYSNNATYWENHLDTFVHWGVKDALIALLEGFIGINGGVSTRQWHTNSSIVNTALVDRWNFKIGVQGNRQNHGSLVYLPVGNLREKVEELAMNVTLSMLGMSDLVYRDTTGASGARKRTVRVTHYRNVYKYEPLNLIISYVLLTVASVAMGVVGIWATRKNGFTATIAPSDIVIATAGLEIDTERKEEALKMKLYLDRDENGSAVFRKVRVDKDVIV